MRGFKVAEDKRHWCNEPGEILTNLMDLYLSQIVCKECWRQYTKLLLFLQLFPPAWVFKNLIWRQKERMANNCTSYHFATIFEPVDRDDPQWSRHALSSRYVQWSMKDWMKDVNRQVREQIQVAPSQWNIAQAVISLSNAQQVHISAQIDIARHDWHNLTLHWYAFGIAGCTCPVHKHQYRTLFYANYA